jgi:hypothetical protein
MGEVYRARSCTRSALGDDYIKLLDFGLAKVAMLSTSASSTMVATSPDVTGADMLAELVKGMAELLARRFRRPSFHRITLFGLHIASD